MKINILKAKIKRNNFEKYAKNFYRGTDSNIVENLKKEGNKALVGIERDDGVYSIIGEKFLYFSTISGNKTKISLENFSNLLHENAMKKGKGSEFEFLRINENEEVWLNNEQTMNAMWNIVLWLVG